MSKIHKLQTAVGLLRSAQRESPDDKSLASMAATVEAIVLVLKASERRAILEPSGQMTIFDITENISP